MTDPNDLRNWARHYYTESGEYASHLAAKWDAKCMRTLEGQYVSEIRKRSRGGDHVLDVGCGAGQSTYLISAFASTVGVDVSFKALQLDRFSAKTRCQFVAGDAHALPFEDQSFDVVASNATVEHLYDLEAALQEMHRVLKPGGYLIICAPNMLSPQRPVKLFLDRLLGGRRHPDARPTSMLKLWLLCLKKVLNPTSPPFYRKPLVAGTSFAGSDSDAVCLVSTFDLVTWARRIGLSILSVGGASSLAGRITLALAPMLAGGIKFVAKKPPPSETDTQRHPDWRRYSENCSPPSSHHG